MKKALKTAAWVAGGIVALVLLAMLLLTLFFPVERARLYAIEKGTAQLGRPVNIEDVSLSFWGGIGVKLERVSIGNPPGISGDPLLQTDNIDVKLRFLPLLTKSISIDRFIVNHPRVSMVKTVEGLTNYSFATLDSTLPPEQAAMPPESKAAAVAISFERLEINNGELHYRDDSSNMSIALENLNTSTALENPSAGSYVSSGRITIDSVRVQSTLPIPVVSLGLNYRAAYDLNRKQITLERADLNVSGVQLDLSGDLLHEKGKERGRCALKAEAISIERLLALAPASVVKGISTLRVSGDVAVDLNVDYQATRPATSLLYSGTAVITNVSLSRRDIVGELKLRRAVLDVKTDNARLNIQDGIFDGKPLKGNLVVTDFAKPNINGELSGYLDFLFLKPFLPPRGEHQLDGEARFAIKFDGPIKEPQKLNLSGDIEIERGRYSSTVLPEPIDTFALDAYFDKSVVNIRKFYGRSKSAELSFTGRVENLVAWLMADSIQAKTIHQAVDGSLSGKADLALAQPFLPASRHPRIKGALDFDLKVTGSTANMAAFSPRGRISVVDASYRDSMLPEPINHLNAEMVLSPDTITVKNLSVQFVSSDATFSGQLAKPFPFFLPLKEIDRSKVARPFFQFKLSSHRFDSDKLFPEAVPGSGAVNPSAPAESLSTFIVPDIDGQGTLAVDTLIYSRVEFTNIKGKMKIYNRKIECYDVTGKAYTGDVSGRTTIDLNDFSNPRYIGDFQASQIEGNDFISRFTKFGGFLYGKFDIKGSYNAAGWEPDQFMKSLTMNGVGGMQDGKLVTSGDALAGLTTLADKLGQSFDKEQPLKALKTNIMVKDGKLMLDQVKSVVGKIGDADLRGSYGMLDNSVDVSGTILLTKDMTQQLAAKGGLLGGIASFGGDQESQRLPVGVRIHGTIPNVKFELDFSKMQKNVLDKLQKDVGSSLQNIFKKKNR